MSDTLELKGALKVLGQTQEFDSGFKKRELVITTEGDYPQDVKLEVVKDKCDLLDKLSLGQVIKVGFNVRGNEYNGKYYVNLQAWKIEAVGSAPQQQYQAPPQQRQQSAGTMQSSVDDGDEIPFAPVQF